MPRPISRKTKQSKAIKGYIRKGYSANEIQRRLKNRNLGIRRKTLLTEIRTLKKQEITLQKRQKGIPKKYRVIIAKPKKVLTLYRTCCVMNNVPITSRPFARNYLGFRVCAFSYSKSVLALNMQRIKNILIQEVERFVGYRVGDWWWSPEIGTEYPTEINVNNPNFLNGRWIFRVEKEGREISERSGFI